MKDMKQEKSCRVSLAGVFRKAVAAGVFTAVGVSCVLDAMGHGTGTALALGAYFGTVATGVAGVYFFREARQEALRHASRCPRDCRDRAPH